MRLSAVSGPVADHCRPSIVADNAGAISGVMIGSLPEVSQPVTRSSAAKAAAEKKWESFMPLVFREVLAIRKPFGRV